MRRFFKTPAISLLSLAVCLTVLCAGCGSAGMSEYESAVSVLNRTAAEGLEEAAHLLGEKELEIDEERVEASVVVLEEAAHLLGGVLEGLKDVKVPSGMEDFHHGLMTLYQANLATCEKLIATLAPGEAHPEGDGGDHGGDEGIDSYGEKDLHEEEKALESAGH
jgi:hypothetical protein